MNYLTVPHVYMNLLQNKILRGYRVIFDIEWDFPRSHSAVDTVSDERDLGGQL